MESLKSDSLFYFDNLIEISFKIAFKRVLYDKR